MFDFILVLLKYIFQSGLFTIKMKSFSEPTFLNTFFNIVNTYNFIYCIYCYIFPHMKQYIEAFEIKRKTETNTTVSITL